MRRRDRRPVGRVFVELVTQRPDRNAQNVRSMRTIAETVPECLENQVSLDLGDRTTDQVSGDLLGGHGGMRGNIGAARSLNSDKA